MTFQQLKYIVAIADTLSMTKAAETLYISQSTISVALNDLESEIGTRIFERTKRGMKPTQNGLDIIDHARQILQHSVILENIIKDNSGKLSFAVSSQHYTFVAQAFMKLCQQYKESAYNFSLWETNSYKILKDVKRGKSEIGILYFSEFNKKPIISLISDYGLEYFILFKNKPHIFIAPSHPLAGRKIIKIEELADYPRLSYDRGTSNSYFFAEEILDNIPRKQVISITDRETAASYLAPLNAYNIGTGVFYSDFKDIISIPLDSKDILNIIYIKIKTQNFSSIATKFIALLHEELKQMTVSAII